MGRSSQTPAERIGIPTEELSEYAGLEQEPHEGVDKVDWRHTITGPLGRIVGALVTLALVALIMVYVINTLHARAAQNQSALSQFSCYVPLNTPITACDEVNLPSSAAGPFGVPPYTLRANQSGWRLHPDRAYTVHSVPYVEQDYLGTFTVWSTIVGHHDFVVMSDPTSGDEWAPWVVILTENHGPGGLGVVVSMEVETPHGLHTGDGITLTAASARSVLLTSTSGQRWHLSVDPVKVTADS